ncbi:serine/threonine protein kinase [Nodularia spumigena CS-584]|uniref:WD40 domain-containing protein n=1 Tax=Nodularia spumigena TaxID=70799 RepID=UPI0000EA9A35|nr:serine/threonine protein kinase [Nodularia spumigena]AHJ28741.1 WD-40 repeat protein [Nodularia spumigena CCY9414]EAW45524.1 Serine/Threonine protein kinase with WD40 repeats [Nodularia spumigena CCY9414]MDB9383301.1 serine/threonine protein kinase [Nodularia spumigena CS-584]
MTRLICGSTGKSITLVGEPLADSGEGKVWRTNDNGYLAKIYHSPTAERVQKLAVMTAHPPTEPNSHLNHISFAWPKSSLKNAQGDCVGFLMPEIKGAKELVDIYNPKRRKTLKLQVDWRFLHTTAQNIASIIAALHNSGYVLGDIKQQNILVNNQALPSIIDTDSFQVRHPQNGKVYRCLVGSEGYTPPELIGKDFSNIDQTEIHDRFRLAVIIYQLLFGGQSPFGGKWIGAGETPEIDELIRQGLWLYAVNSPFQPVDRTIPIEIVHPEIQRCFLRCFNDGHKNPHLRPTAREWLAALKVASNSLMPCERIDGHYYSQTYGKCYWCDRSTNLGVDIFPGTARTLLICGSTSQSIALLGEPLADSGEGKVWRTNQNGYLAKIYHSPTVERGEKLAFMITHPPTEVNYGLNHISFAWPISSLKNAQGDCVGFLMPEIKDAKELLDIYNPQRRKRLKLQVDWRFLHTTAQNIASIIAALHNSGYVLGDIKQQNILVNNQALPSIIDTDSFQVRHPQNGKVYRCLVGSQGYTPPELIGKDFSNIDQTEIHDRFRLAVIIYQLLFGGQSPFGGKWIGAGETPEMDELICLGLWLYAPNSPFQPVERTIPIEIVHPEIQRCFLRCFNDGHKNPNLRPTAREWLAALKVASNSLMPCERIDGHYYSQTYGKCYWCDRSTKLGVDIFPGVVKPKPSVVVKSISQPQVIKTNQSLKNSTTGKLLQTLSEHFDSVSSVAYSRDGQTLASGSWDKTIKIWDVTTGNLLQTLTGHSNSINSVAYSHDGQTLASGSWDKTIKIWNVTTGNLVQTLTGHSENIWCVAYSPDGQTLASASVDRTIKLWDVSTGKLLQTFPGHSHSINSVAYSHDGQTLASGSSDKTIKLWDVSTGKLLQTLSGHSEAVVSIAFSPDGQTLASGSADNTIKLWDVATARLLQTLSGHSYGVSSVAFCPDSQTLASGSGDNTIKLWNVSTGRLVRNLSGHSDWVFSVAFSPDGQTLASGSKDRTIKIWQMGASPTTSSSVKPTQPQVSQPTTSTSQSLWIDLAWNLFLILLSCLSFGIILFGILNDNFVMVTLGLIGIVFSWLKGFQLAITTLKELFKH